MHQNIYQLALLIEPSRTLMQLRAVKQLPGYNRCEGNSRIPIDAGERAPIRVLIEGPYHSSLWLPHIFPHKKVFQLLPFGGPHEGRGLPVQWKWIRLDYL